jgi:hypothetical protein
MSCTECFDSEVFVDGVCADCFWEADAAFRRKKRRDIDWIFQRRMSAMAVIHGLSPDEAFFHAMQWRLRYVVACHLGMSHEEAMGHCS